MRAVNDNINEVIVVFRMPPTYEPAYATARMPDRAGVSVQLEALGLNNEIQAKNLAKYILLEGYM